MVTGHLATAYLARTRWHRAALLPLLVASIVPDLADFALPQGDQCHTSCELYTHAMPAVFVLALGAGVLVWAIYHRRTTAILAGGLVLLHVCMDLITGFKPYWPGGPSIGLQFYGHPLWDFLLESVIVIGAWTLLRRTKGAPRLAVHPAALGALMLLQAGFDLYQASRHRG
jgi:hypothetical protein